MKNWCVQSWSMVVLFGFHKMLLFRGIRKRAKVCCQYCKGNYNYETESMTDIL